MEYMVLQVPGNAGYKDKGESTLTGYKGDINVLSFSWNVSNPMNPDITAVGRTSGKPNFGELVITKKLDATSALFAFSCAGGEDLGEVHLVLLRQDMAQGADAASNLPYMIFNLTDTLCSSVSVGGSGDIPIETITLSYSKMGWHYEPQKVSMGDETDKKTIKGWNVATNAPASVEDGDAGAAAAATTEA